MNKEFKFWDNERKIMYDWTWAQGRTMTIFSWDHVLQWTGMYDWNSKKIYEGDIITFSDLNGIIMTMPVCIVFSLGSFGFVYKDSFYPLAGLHMSKDRKVIGNIYENPEIKLAPDF